MKHAKLLDCTLRDGAYLVDKKFGETTILGIVDGLVKANIDFVEIGFFQDDGFGEGKTVYLNSVDAKKYIPKEKKKSKFTVLADCSRYSVENLDECDTSSIDAVRECFFKKEISKAMENCKIIKQKGYMTFVQPVDILGYTDKELLDLIEQINEIEPYCLSIVDTFGSMYQDDLIRVFELMHHNLIPTCRIGFHSHNNMQMSNALSQSFIDMTYGKREVVIDGTLSGMGRGAGNTPIELLVEYMNAKLGYQYDMDMILDLIDGYMDNIKAKCSWGYTIPYFVAGCYSAHVNNIAYLIEKKSIASKDIRHILDEIGEKQRKRYDYGLLEKTYYTYINTEIDDEEAMDQLHQIFDGRNVLIVAPGKTVNDYCDSINQYITNKQPIVISINFIPEKVHADYFFTCNIKRYNYWKLERSFAGMKKIITSNVQQEVDGNDTLIVSLSKLIKCGWKNLDNATIVLLRLLDQFELSSIAMAGFDGYSDNQNSNYVEQYLELSNVNGHSTELNEEIIEMLTDYNAQRIQKYPICFLTPSNFSRVFEAK